MIGNVSSLPALEKRWRLKLLLLFHVIGALLVSSLFWPVTRVYWEMIDIAVFKFLNGSLEGRPYWQTFWAMANHKYADWLEDLFFFGFFAVYIRQAHKLLRPRKIFQALFCILYCAAIIYFINGLLFRRSLCIPNMSPTLVMDSSIRLSEHVTWLKIKESASKSFPGDHGTTAFLFASVYTYLAGWRLGILACLYAAFLCIPRMITGAHWLSDILVGSGTIVMVLLSWAFCTPLFDSFVSWCERSFLFKKTTRPNNPGSL